MKKIYHLSHTDLDGYGCQAVVEHFRTGMYQMFRRSNTKASKVDEILEDKEPLIKLDVEYFNSNYGEEITKTLTHIFKLMKSYRECGDTDEMLLLITDLNLTEEQAKFVEENIDGFENTEVVLLDHHISGKEVAKDRKWYRLDTTSSGTMLTFLYFFKMFYPDRERSETDIMELAMIVDTYDLWKEQNEKEFSIGKCFSFYLNSVNHYVPRKIYQQHHDGIVRDLVFYVSYACDTDKKVYDLFRHVVIEFVKDTYELDSYPASLQDAIELIDVKSILSELDCSVSDRATILNSVGIPPYRDNQVILELGVYYSDKHISSSVMNKVLKEKPEIFGLMVINPSGTASLRSTGKLDVSKIAKLFGGGGHLCAAGCKFERKDESTTIGEYVNYIVNYIADTVALKQKDEKEKENEKASEV